MNCNDCQRTILENGGRDHSADVIAHIESCPPCAKVNERTVTIARLLSLKNHEQPHPHFEIRTAAAIRKRLTEEKPPLFAWNPLSLFRPVHALLGTACVCLAIGGVYFTSKAPPQSAAGVAVQPPVETVQPAAIPAPLIGNDKPVVVVQDAPPGKPVVASQTKFGAETNLIKPADFKVPGP
jgi:hypothetical protein